MIYKNISSSVKTFHGVTFKPGEIKEVPGYINSKYFIRVNSMPQEPPRSVESVEKPSRSKTKKDTKDLAAPESTELVELIKEESSVNGTDSN